MKTIKINLTPEQRKRFKERIEADRERRKKMINEVPAINWEILKYSNSHTYEETVEKFPEHKKFIDTIVWGR